MRIRHLVTALALVLAGAPPALQAQATPEAKEAKPAVTAEPEVTVTRHQVTVDGERIRYTATTGYMPLTDEDGTLKARVFFIAYTRDEVEDPGRRPVTFAFNGGPGSSSVWLHLGALGPRRVQMSRDGGAPAPASYRLVKNPHTWLDRTDLVFIDPVTTGYSRAASDEDPKQFHGVEEDIRSVGEFIRLYTTRYNRWASPKFLAGESYGTTRAAGLSGYLQDRYGMYLNGIVLVSAVLDFQTLSFDPGNDLPYILYLPTYTATAWYHGQLPAELQQQDLRTVLDEAEAFALGDYTLALMQGSDLPAQERKRIARELARYTGLSPEYVDRTDLRIKIHRFTKELLRDRRRTVGRLDSRFTGIDRDAAGEHFEFDPSYQAIYGPYTALLYDYVRRELGFESPLTYEILTGRVRPWNYGDAENRYVNVAETLRRAMSKNRHLKVFVASGYYDLATPYFASVYTVNHLGLDPSLRDHITMAFYESGHMMYIHEPSLARLKADVAAFYDDALRQDALPVADHARDAGTRVSGRVRPGRPE